MEVACFCGEWYGDPGVVASCPSCGRVVTLPHVNDAVEMEASANALALDDDELYELWLGEPNA